MGVVYSGHDPGIGRDVAIKTIHAHLLQGEEGEDLRKRFNLEVKAVGKLTHPNIVAIYDSDEVADENGTLIPYFVMEFVTGKELQHYLAHSQRWPLSKILDIAQQMLDAFEYTHKLNIIHRDVKPANVFITDEGKVKIADFGIARVDNSSMTQTGAVIGTPNYMSPEQCTGQVMDSRSDLFSIAIVIYEMLTGEQPFNANNVHAVMVKVVQSNPEAPSVLNPTLPKGLDTVIAKALAKSPDDRYQTAAEFSKALGPFLRPGKASDDATVNNATKLMGVSAVEKKTSKNKRLLPIMIATVSVVAVLGLGAGVYFSGAKLEQESNDAEIDVSALAPYASASLSSENKAKVDRLLKTADLHESREFYVYPTAQNAHYVFNTVLEIDPGNPRALAGINRIQKKFEDQAKLMYRDKDFELLSAHLQAGLGSFPNSSTLNELKRELDRLESN